MLMDRFYESYVPGGDPVRALALTQRALIASPATSHPYTWAGFVVVGGAQ
jgi:CHAT domain-containing protein